MDLVEKLINEGIKRGVFPGASLLVARGSEILYEKTAGQAQMEPSPRLLKKNTLFDISSLTKPIATATLYMLVWQEKKIELDAPAKSFFPKITESYTIRQLLNHTSGLPDWRPYYKSVKNKTGLIEKIIFEPLLSTPGEKVLYSDLGYILLGNILENIYKKKSG